ncbi:FAD dependent oxidoreductase [Lineolata rhizophorae]|uniref:FAD dependent oxidoreductase n=1 Tax=Lineolata rhizophorae TaxID=578093 RepID=A0A6A6NZH1_9PEZI|nr:FAD dependent oxidoreductase [Lineolata rhizophorae]
MSNTVIVGAGIIGCSTAYYLSQSSHTPAQNIHLVESNPELFKCASGLAGGFLAADWFAPSVAPLGALSFRLHKRLADEHGGRDRWGYCRSTGTSLSQGSEDAVGGSGEDWLLNGTSRAQAAGETKPDESDVPSWLRLAEGASLEVISRDHSVAQLDPMRLCKFLIAECKARGVQVHHPATVLSVSKDIKDELASVRIADSDGSETDLPCSRLLLTCGAWTPKVFTTLFPRATVKIPVSSLGGHSVLVRSPRWGAQQEAEDKGCHAVFATDTLGFAPEVFSRLGGEIYIAGLNTATLQLPQSAAEVGSKPESLEQIKRVAKRLLGLSEEVDDLEVLRESLCFRPITSSGRPIVSRVPDAKLGGIKTRGGGDGGVFVSAGHGAWGISQSLGTGMVLCELLEGRPTSCDVKALQLA